MSPSVAPHAARQESQNDTEVAATAVVPAAKCFLQYVLSAAKILKYPLNLAVISRFTVAIATVKSDRVDSAVSNLKSIHGLDNRAHVCSS